MTKALCSILTCFGVVSSATTPMYSQDSIAIDPGLRPRDLGISIGIFEPGPLNAITDVPGVAVGQVTLVAGEDIRTGVTAILPHTGNLFSSKVPAAISVANGFGKLAGSTQVEELGYVEAPIILTNTLSVGAALEAGVRHILNLPGNESVYSVNVVVGETNDGYLNDIRGLHVKEEHVRQAIVDARSGAVSEGNAGAGTGTVCFGYKGGIGTASRVLPKSLGGHTLGVLVQTNFGGDLTIAGISVGRRLGHLPYSAHLTGQGDGSCMIVLITDAPLDARNLKRLASRAIVGMGRTGASMSNGSGDYAIALSVHPGMMMPHHPQLLPDIGTVPKHNDLMSPLFMAAIEATEEAIINSLFAAQTMTGRDGHRVDRLPVEQIINWFHER